MGGAALCDHIACAALALAALGGDAEFELHFVEGHPSAHVARDLTVRHSAAYANDHGGGRQSGWLLVGDAIINTNSSHLQ